MKLKDELIGKEIVVEGNFRINSFSEDLEMTIQRINSLKVDERELMNKLFDEVKAMN